jgi:adenylate cyclase
MPGRNASSTVPEGSARPRRGLRDALRSRAVAALAIGVAAWAAVIGARQQGWLQSLELGAYDGFLRLRPTSPDAFPVTLVWIREDEITRFGHPLPDRLMAAALHQLLQHGPRAVGIDVYRDRPAGEGWDELARVVLAHPEVVVVEKLPDQELPGVPAPAFLSDDAQVGFADIVTDPDGVTRRGLLLMWDEQGRAHVSFSLRLALRWLHAEDPNLGMTAAPEDPSFVRIGATTLPPLDPDFGGYRNVDAGGYQYLLDYGRPNDSFPKLYLADVLDGRFDPGLVTGRVVVLGTSSPSVKDNFQTPTGFGMEGDAVAYGAEHHAQATDQLVRLGMGRARPIGTWPEGLERAWILLWCLLGAALGTRAHSPISLIAAGAAGLAILAGSAWWALAGDRWIPVMPAAAGGLGALAVMVAWMTQRERAEKAKAVNLFGRYVSKRLVDRIWDQRDLFMQGGRPVSQRITVTVLLSDLIGYTTRSETSEPAEVMEWLGTYTDRMAQLVEEHGGIVNDFLGDGIMASFGVPIPSTSESAIRQDAIQAVECALAMGEALAELNAGWRERGQPTARMRVGILTGPAVVGDIGSERRMKYATVGNTVNTASRLESFDKEPFELEPEQSTIRILIGQATADLVSDRFVTRCLGDHLLKGKGEPITIHRVLGRHGDPAP